MDIRSLVAAFLCWSTIASGQTSVAAKTYDVEDAYQIYNLLLPHEESYGRAKGMLIIQEETMSKVPASLACLTPEKAQRFKDAIADYTRLNRKKGLLTRRLQIKKSYEILSSDAIVALFKNGGWDRFYKRYPDSGGYFTMSSVGFNKQKTRAVVYTGSACGSRCGRWRFHLVKKINGNWKEVPGVSCFAAF